MFKIGAAEAKVSWFSVLSVTHAQKMLDPEIPIMHFKTKWEHP